jgi:hypothetical protein
MSMTADEILQHVRALPPDERLKLVELVVHDLAVQHASATPASVIGAFSDEPELIETVCEEAMQARALSAPWSDMSDEEFQEFLDSIQRSRRAQRFEPSEQLITDADTRASSAAR